MNGVLGAAVMSGFKGDAVVNDGAKDERRNQELQDSVNAVFHGVVWVVGWPDRSGWVNGSGYLGGVNPEKWVVVIRDLDALSTVNVIPLHTNGQRSMGLDAGQTGASQRLSN